MSNDITSSRESARKSDGKFGEQARTESGTPLENVTTPLDAAIDEFDRAVQVERDRSWNLRLSPSEQEMDAAVSSIRNLADHAGDTPLVGQLRHDIATYEGLEAHHPAAFNTLLLRAARVRDLTSKRLRQN